MTKVLRVLVYLPPLYGHVFPVVPTMLELVDRGHSVVVHASGAIASVLRPLLKVIPGMPSPRLGEPQKPRALYVRQEASVLAAGFRAIRPDVVLVHEGCLGARQSAHRSGLPWVRVCVSPLPQSLETTTVTPLPTLYYTAWPLEARVDLPQFVHLVGPALWEPPATTLGPRFCQDEEVILVTRSTHFDAEHDVLKDVLDAFPDPSVRVVVTGQGAGSASGPIPPHVTVVDYAPHMPLLRHARCVVTHAGPGIAQKALWSGRPMCVLPGGRVQQPVAAQLVATGAALRLPEIPPRAVALRAGIEDARRLETRARAIAADWQGRPPGEKLAADVVERCVLAVKSDRP